MPSVWKPLTPPTLAEVQDFIGGYVEVIHLVDGGQMLINENGMADGLSPNPYATVQALKAGYNVAGQVRGNCVILRGDALWT